MTKRHKWMCDFERKVLEGMPAHAGHIEWYTARQLYFTGSTAEDAAKRYVKLYE